MEQKQEYRSILKATALFGGVQVFQILVSLIRTKVIAVLLGVEGVGLLSLFNNTLLMLQNACGLGVNQGGVKSISGAGSEERKAQIAALIRRLTHYTGLLGTLLVLCLAPWLSRWTFGTAEYTGAFLWLSFTLLFDTMTKGELAIFQGTRRLRALAKANLTGATAGLALSIPIYYFWHVDGITIAILLSSVCSYLGARFFRNPATAPALPLRPEGLHILRIGSMQVVSVFAATLASYLFNIYLRHHGGLEDVGLYQSGFNLIDRYVGLLFTAMVSDYYPRLAAVHQYDGKLKTVLNRQMVVSLLFIGPIISLFLPTSPFIVRILLSESFLPVIPFLSWAILGTVFKACSFCFSYLLIVKGATRLFLGIEFLSCATILASNIIGYRLWGIEGIGIAFLFSYVCYLISVGTACRIRYRMRIRRETITLLTFTLAVSAIHFLLVRYWIPDHPLSGYTASALLIAGTSVFSLKRLWKHAR